jgi:hypothetical protein
MFPWYGVNMNRLTFAETRLSDDLLRTRVMQHRNIIVGQCCKCGGSGFIHFMNTVKICRCIKRFNIIKNIIISGAPMEAYEVYKKIHSRGRGMVDVQYRRVDMSIDAHGIREISHKKLLYKDLIKPYISHSTEALLSGDSILLFGHNSRGKTWALYYMIVCLMLEHSVLFINLKDLYTVLNDALFGQDIESRQQSKRLFNIIRDVDLLLIDEGSKLPKFTDHVSVQLEGLVKERVGNCKSVVMASNHSPEEFAMHFGSQVVSAFIKNVYSAHILNGPDLRHGAMKASKAFSYLRGK